MNGGSEDDRFALQRTNPKFLIVDDEPMLINAALRMLRRFDIPAQDILKADSPSRAIESFDANAASIRAILSDMMMMPNGTGLDLYRHVRPKRPDLAFAFWSGGMPSHIQSELDAVLALDPNVRFLEKPASLATLSAWFQGAWLLAEPV